MRLSGPYFSHRTPVGCGGKEKRHRDPSCTKVMAGQEGTLGSKSVLAGDAEARRERGRGTAGSRPGQDRN